MEPATSEIKEVIVTGDAATYLEPKKRTRRARRKQEGGDLLSDITSGAESVVKSATTSAESALSSVKSGVNSVISSVEPATSAPAPVSAPVATVTTLRNAEGNSNNLPVSSADGKVAVARIKPALVVGGAPVVKLVPKLTKVSTIVKKPSIPLTRKKRTFKAKRVSVMIAEADPKTRKARNSIAKKVAAMSLEQLQKELEDKGLMKKGKKEIPEEMLRSMMRDALTLSEGK